MSHLWRPLLFYKILQKQLVPLALKWWRSPQLLVGLSKNNSNDANIFLRTFQAQRKPVWMVNNCKHANVYYVIFLNTTSSNIEITTFLIIMISFSFFKIQKIIYSVMIYRRVDPRSHRAYGRDHLTYKNIFKRMSAAKVQLGQFSE